MPLNGSGQFVGRYGGGGILGNAEEAELGLKFGWQIDYENSIRRRWQQSREVGFVSVYRPDAKFLIRQCGLTTSLRLTLMNKIQSIARWFHNHLPKKQIPALIL